MTTLDNLRKAAKRWLKALRDGDLEARERYARAYPDGSSTPGLRDVQHALARERGYESWVALTRAAGQAVERDTPLTRLLDAAGKGDVEAVAAILDEHPGIIDERGTLPGNSGLRTALHFGSGREPIVRLLLERGADPNIRDEGDNAYPIHFAAERGDLPVVRLLVEHGADPDGAGTSHELNAVGWAVCFDYVNHVEVARYLLAHGAKHDLFTAVALGDVDAIRDVVRAGADLNQRMDRTNLRRTALHLAVVKEQPAALAALLDAGADPNVEDAAGLTPLDQAALDGQAATTERLLAGGAELRFPAAIALGRSDDVERLARDTPGLLTDESNRMWARLVVQASRRAPRHVLEAVLRTAERHRSGLTIVNMQDDPATAVDGARGYTPLHAAAFAGNDEAVDVLLAHGANPRARDGKYCATPAGWAQYAGHTATAERILAADIDIFDAIRFDRADRIEDILNRDPGALDRPFKAYAADCPAREGQWWPTPETTPLQWATAQGKENAVRVLAERGAGRTPEQVAHAERVTRFLQLACWDHHVHGKADHRMYDRAAARLLAQHPEIATDNVYTAIVCGELETVRRIIAGRPDIARQPGGPRGWTPILYSTYTRFTHPRTIENGVAIARMLLDHGANPNDFYMAGDARYTALVGAAGEGEQDSPRQPYALELFRLLVERGADPFDIQVLYNTHFSGDMLWWLDLVYEHSMNTGREDRWRDPEWPMLDMGARGSGARFLIHLALEKRNMRLLEWVLARGANPNAATSRAGKWRRWTPYEEAIAVGWPEAADLLARHGARRSAPELSGDEQFLAACLAKDRERVSAMLEREPRLLDRPDTLFAAARRNRADVVAMLLDLGMSPDITGEGGQRPLHAAAAHNAVDAARVLIDRGADVDAEEPVYHSTPMGWASHGDRQEMLDFLSTVSHDPWRLAFRGYVDRLRAVLRAQPALAKSVDREGYTLLWWLPDDEDRALEIVDLLLAHGADPAHRVASGRTAADWAATRSMTRVEQRLRGAGLLSEGGSDGDLPPKGGSHEDLPPEGGSHVQPEEVAQYERLARDLVVAYETGQAEALRRLETHFGRALTQDDVRAGVWRRVHAVRHAGGPVHYFNIDDARDLLAREAGYGNWAAFAAALSGGPAAPIRPVYFVDRDRKAIRPARHLTDADWQEVLAVADRQKLTTIEAGGQLTDALLGRIASLTHVTRIEFNGTGLVTDAGLAHLKRMPQLEELELSQYPAGRITDRGLEVLKHLPALRAFDMTWQANVTDAGLANLSACDRLESVNVLGTRTGDGAVRALAGKPRLRRLLTGRTTTDAGLARLADIPAFAARIFDAAHLGIEGPFTDAGLRALAGLDGVAILDIGGTSANVTAAGLRVLVDMPSLRALSCDGDVCDDAALGEIARIPRLRDLSCQDTVSGDEGFAALSASATLESIWGRRCYNLRGRGFAALSRMPALRKLGVSCRNVDDEALATLPDFPALAELTPIDVTDEGFRHVGRCERLEVLMCMYCRDTTDAATEHIAGLSRLRKYYAGQTRITGRSLEILSRMDSLETIQLWNCAGVTDAGVAALARLPRLKELAVHDCAQVTLQAFTVFPASTKVDFA